VLPVFPVPRREVGGVISALLPSAMPCTVVLARSAAGMVHLQPLPMINPGGSPGLAGGMWHAWGERGGMAWAGEPGAGGSGAGVNGLTAAPLPIQLPIPIKSAPLCNLARALPTRQFQFEIRVPRGALKKK
jgi:hypothetical protein